MDTAGKVKDYRKVTVALFLSWSLLPILVSADPNDTSHRPESSNPISWNGTPQIPLEGYLESGLLLSASAGEQAVFTVNQIVLRGDPAPGFDQPMFFADFGSHPQLEQVTGADIQAANIDSDGDIAFHAYVTPDGSLGTCLFGGECVPHGLFRIVDNVTTRVALAGDTDPFTQQPILGFPAVAPSTPQVGEGTLSFMMSTGDNPFCCNQFGIWTEVGDSFEPLAIIGETQLPGMSENDELAVPMFFETEGNNVYLFAKVESLLGGGEFRPEGFWRFRNGEPEAIAVVGQQAPDMPEGTLFGQGNVAVDIIGTIGTFDSNRSGRVVFTAFVNGNGSSKSANEAIWVETDTGFEVLVAEGEIVPQGPFTAGSTFSGGSILSHGGFVDEVSPRIRMNDRGQIVFFAQVDEPEQLPRVPTLWSNRNGKLELIFRGEQRLVAFSVPGEPAPGVENGRFFFPSNIDIDGNGSIFVRAFVETDLDIFTDVLGIWVKHNDEWEPIAFEEGPVPGLPGVTFLPEINNVRGVDDFRLHEDGTAIYTGRFIVDGQTTIGVFRYNPDGSNEMLFKIGDPIDVGGDGEDTRVLTGFRFGEGASASGDRVVEMSFADGSRGLFTASIAQSLATPRILQRFGAPGETQPFTGYIDPRQESTDGINVDLGLDEITIEFSERVRNIDGTDLSVDAFEIRQPPSDNPVSIASIESSNDRNVVVRLDQPINLGGWTTIIANVEDTDGNKIVRSGDLGEGQAETDRIDIAFLPGDVDQNGSVSPLDLLAFRQIVNGNLTPLRGLDANFVDINRDGSVSPLDLLRFRQLINGVSPATQSWAGQTLTSEQP